jgi:hypothetical protein
MQVKAASDAHPTGDATQQPSAGSQFMGNMMMILANLCYVWCICHAGEGSVYAHPTGDATQQPSAGSQPMGNVVDAMARMRNR